MNLRISRFLLRLGAFAILLSSAVSAQQTSGAETFLDRSAVPVIFTHTVSAAKAKVGSVITAKTMQALTLGSNVTIPKGSLVVGHVVQAAAFRSEDVPSILEVHFDKIVTKNQVIPVALFVRALANVNESNEAENPILPRDMNLSGERQQIGGDQVEPLDSHVHNSDDDIVGQNKKDGIYAKLQPAQFSDRYTHFSCDGTAVEQPVAIYSVNSCGLYGFVATYLTHTGADAPIGVFQLESNRHAVTLYAGSTALLQVAGKDAESAHLR